jgi:hypothetical protein
MDLTLAVGLLLVALWGSAIAVIIWDQRQTDRENAWRAHANRLVLLVERLSRCADSGCLDPTEFSNLRREVREALRRHDRLNAGES